MKFSYAFLSFCICNTGIVLAADKPANILDKKAISHPSSDESGRRAASEVVAAIKALGENPTDRQVSNVVFAAVRKSPENVLAIVDAAVRVSPQSAAPAIVTAATAGVPNPWKRVGYRRTAAARDYKSGPDGKQGRDGGRNMDLGGREPGAAGNRTTQGGPGGSAGGPGSNASGDSILNGGGLTNGSTFWNSGQLGTGGTDTFVFDANAADGNSVTLAEAIAFTAFQAQPGLSFASLTTAVDIALRTDPGVLLGIMQSSRAVSGVGDAGSSNYANEPLRPRSLGGNPAIPAPIPPVVSR